LLLGVLRPKFPTNGGQMIAEKQCDMTVTGMRISMKIWSKTERFLV
jgi:hypothetical protein